MKRIFAFAVAIVLAPIAGAQLYKYVDKDGKTVYTDQPPANVESKPMHVQPVAPAAPAGKGPGNKSYVERDKDLEKGREQSKEKQKKAEEIAQRAQQNEQRCTQARSALQLFSEGGRIIKYNDKGERVYLGDSDIEAERDRLGHEVDEACKKS